LSLPVTCPDIIEPSFFPLSSEAVSAHIQVLRGVGTRTHWRDTFNSPFLPGHSSELKKCPSEWQLNPKGSLC
jgi:hypothetical protein